MDKLFVSLWCTEKNSLHQMCIMCVIYAHMCINQKHCNSIHNFLIWLLFMWLRGSATCFHGSQRRFPVWHASLGTQMVERACNNFPWQGQSPSLVVSSMCTGEPCKSAVYRWWIWVYPVITVEIHGFEVTDDLRSPFFFFFVFLFCTRVYCLL